MAKEKTNELEISINKKEEELRNQIHSNLEAWNNREINKISIGMSRGFGFRTISPRTNQNFSPEIVRAILEQFFASVEYYKIIPGDEDSNVEIDGNIGMVWGFHIEEIKHKDRPKERIRVRSSATYRRDEKGVWHELLGHRDIQRFQENGQYIPVYEE